MTVRFAKQIDAGAKFDVVVANILADTLVDLASMIEQALVLNGSLALSGILSTQQQRVKCAYPRIRFGDAVIRNTWVLLTGSRSTDA